MYIEKLDTLQKSRQFALRFIHKNPDTLCYTIFHENIGICIYIYKKHDTFRYVTFYIQKARHFEESKTICVTFFYIQNS